jgi:uncharacterized DUF497 family protein
MPEVVRELLVTITAIKKLGARGISEREVGQLPRNRHVTCPNPRRGGERRLLIGHTDGGGTLTLVIERTLEPSAWLVISGWKATKRERKMLEVER